MISTQRLLVLLAFVVATSVLATPSARADIVATPQATRICAGLDGSGIRWSIGLNEGWHPSKKLHYRVTLTDPHGVKRGFQNGSTDGYWDSGTLAQARDIYEKTEYPAHTGTYTFVLELKVDPGYADIGVGPNAFWPRHTGRWVARTWKIRVFTCP